MWLKALVLFCILETNESFYSQSRWHWNWSCQNERCIRSVFPIWFSRSNIPTSLEMCKLFCGKYGSLWPQPTGHTVLGDRIYLFNPKQIKWNFSNIDSQPAKEYTKRVSRIFLTKLLSRCGLNCMHAENEVTVYFAIASPDLSLNWKTNESYSLDVSKKGTKVTVKIRSITVYGARHALETLTQLISSYSPFESSTKSSSVYLVSLSTVKIIDSPMYPHRGLLLDTARNFMSVSTIRRTLDAMAMTKLNILHWHVTDSQSFPLETPRVPQLSRNGAYSSEQIYTVHDATTIIEYARLRGIRVIIEIDAPAHAGNGWQWGEVSNLGKLAVCVNKEPWRHYCIQPPCGQLNPVNPNLFKVLRNLYEDIIDLLPPGEAFHMGGDEVFISCWNSSEEIVSWLENNERGRTHEDFMNLWGEYQESALRSYDEVNPIPDTPIILWSSKLTHPDVIKNYLNSSRYVIETWVEAKSQIPYDLLTLGYKLIMATKDKWYLDHGFWGNTIYHNWRVAYDNILPKHENILGGETTMWSELADDSSVDIKIWPRAAAVGERLWSDPITRSNEAEPRFQQFRQRLVEQGINADAISPFYCYQNERKCL